VSNLFGGAAIVAPNAYEVVSSPGFASECPLGVHTHHALTCNARGYAKILAGVSILAIPPSFDSPVTSGVSLDLESTTRAQTELPSGLAHPPATTPSANVSLPSVPAVCPSVSDFLGGIASAAHKVFEVVSSPWSASGCPLGVHTLCVQPCLAGGHAEILAGASILANPSSSDHPVTSGASLDPESIERAPPPLPSGFEQPTATTPSADAGPASTLAACLPASDLFGGTDSVVHKVFDVAPGRCTASECLVEVHPNDSLPGAARCPTKLLAGASILAIQPSFESTADSRTSPDLDSNASASTKLPHWPRQ